MKGGRKYIYIIQKLKMGGIVFMNKLKSSLALILSLTIIGSMVGCGKSTKTDTKSKDVTLRMVESITSPERTVLLNDLIKKFESQNPGVKVELISPPLQNADDKINQMLMSKQPLDVLEVRDLTVKQLVNNKYLESLDNYMKDWDGMKTLTDIAKEKAKAIGGASYMIPYGFYEKILYYRADWFKEKNLNPPKTWQELYDIGKKFTDPAKNRYGYSFRGGPGGAAYAFMLMQTYINAPIDRKSSFFTTDSKTIFDQSGVVDALKFYTKIYEDISPKDSLNWGYPEMVENFYSGITAMLIQDPEVIATCQQKMKEGTWATAPLPVGPNGKAYYPVGYAGWGITSYSEHKQEAWKLVSFLSSEANNTDFSKKNSLIPVHKTAANDEFYKTGAFKAYIDMANMKDTHFDMEWPLDYKGWGPFGKTSDQDMQKMLLKKVTPEEVAKNWGTFWTDELKNK